MSFKRDADDKSQLNVLRQRRVKDLLYEDIPEDEASLLSNGRLACMVCHHRPIFDTVNMLSLHRQGKRHLASEEYQRQQALDVELLIQRRKQEQFVQDGTTDIDQAPQSATVLRYLGERVAYDPRAKKSRSTPGARRTKVDLYQPALASETKNFPSTCTDTSDLSSLPGNRESGSSIGQGQSGSNIGQGQSGSIKGQGRQSEKFDSTVDSGKNNVCGGTFVKNRSSQEWVKPYKQSVGENTGKVLHRKRHLEDKDDITLQVGDVKKFINPVSSELGVKHYLARKQLKRDIQDKFTKQEESVEHLAPVTNSKVSWNDFKSRGRLPSSVQPAKTVQPSKSQTAGDQLQSSQGDSNRSSGEAVEKTRAEKLAQLRGAGWKRDWDGKWVRDEDAEFDSDEEMPEFS